MDITIFRLFGRMGIVLSLYEIYSAIRGYEFSSLGSLLAFMGLMIFVAIPLLELSNEN